MIAALHRFKKLCHREWLLQWRQPTYLCNALLFFIMMMVFFPLTLPSKAMLLHQLAPGLVFIAVLFVFLLLSERFFHQDYEDGMFDQWLVSGHSLVPLSCAKLLVYWLLTLIPLLLFCPMLSLLFAFTLNESLVLSLSLLFSTPAMLALCVLAAAFSIGRQQKGLLTALILLPLTLPLMIFGSSAVMMAGQGLDVSGYLAMLLAMSLLSSTCLPFAIASVLRVGLE